MLGNSLSEIAFEKAGIIKENTPAVIGEYHPETFPVFENIANDKNVPLFLAEEYTGELEFGGIYQRKNLGTFIKCVQVIEEFFLTTKNTKKSQRTQRLNNYDSNACVLCENSLCSLWLINNAIQNLQKNTGFMGRWQIISKKPFTVCDVAHNPAGIELAMEQLQQLPHHNLHIIIGFVNDKDIDEITPLLPKNATYYACQAQIERAMPAEELCAKLCAVNLNVINAPNVIDAYNQALSNAQENDIIFIGGSFFVVGEFLQKKNNG
jgi:dihydrofolate synthase/folylpolyglutamate synthase